MVSWRIISRINRLREAAQTPMKLTNMSTYARNTPRIPIRDISASDVATSAEAVGRRSACHHGDSVAQAPDMFGVGPLRLHTPPDQKARSGKVSCEWSIPVIAAQTNELRPDFASGEARDCTAMDVPVKPPLCFLHPFDPPHALTRLGFGGGVWF